MNDLTMTVTGWVATEPKLHVSANGVSMATFRLAATPRYFDKGADAWADAQTEWFTVRAFRAAATFVAKSIHKSQPVTVQGRFRTSTWEAEDGTRTDLVLDVITLGHDLTRGVADYNRAVVAADDAAEASAVDTDTEQPPVTESDREETEARDVA